VGRRRRHRRGLRPSPTRGARSQRPHPRAVGGARVRGRSPPERRGDWSPAHLLHLHLSAESDVLITAPPLRGVAFSQGRTRVGHPCPGHAAAPSTPENWRYATRHLGLHPPRAGTEPDPREHHAGGCDRPARAGPRGAVMTTLQPLDQGPVPRLRPRRRVGLGRRHRADVNNSGSGPLTGGGWILGAPGSVTTSPGPRRSAPDVDRRGATPTRSARVVA